MRGRRHGFAMATTLYVVFVILLFGLTMATMASFQYQFAHDAVNRGRALEAAQSGLARAIYNMCDDSSWGKNRESITDSVSDDGSSYTVTFDAASGLPYSVNNLAGSTSVAGWNGQAVPPHSALLVSRGSISNLTGGIQARTVEAVVQFSSYPYGVAASNKIDVSKSLTVRGANSIAEAITGDTEADGSVYSGSTSASAVKAGSNTTVSGSVRTPGGVKIDSPYVVEDGVDTGIAAEVVPDIDIMSYNNKDWEDVTVLLANGTYTAINGPTYVNGNITLAGAVLNNAYLYVDGGGDLKSILGLTGTGTIFVTGKTRIEGVATLLVNTGIAVFSEGDLTITGGNNFQGVLYTHGTLEAQSTVTVIGAVVAQSDNSSEGRIECDKGLNVIYLAEYTQFGSYWEGSSMQGSLLNGGEPLLKTLFWREVL